MKRDDSPRRRGLPDAMAILFGLLALSNASKALQWLRNPALGGIVLLGRRIEGVVPNLLLGGLLAAFLAAYALALWRRSTGAIPLSIAYALWVPLNLALFWYFKTGTEVPPVAVIAGYFAVAIGGSVGSALWVAYHREEFA
ncbi:MAG: hypothetical protein RL698_1987 [Pseudomonadota bacterium]|jgi:hypothetical protein